jgi:hypothetical protein
MNKFNNLEWLSQFDEDQYEILYNAYKSGLSLEDIDKIDDPRFKPSQLTVLVDALKNNVDVTKFNRPEYNYLQMEEISKALQKGLDIMPLISPRTGEREIQQIRLGLENGLTKEQINEYNKPIYTYRQMSQLRQGLEQGLDIKEFDNPDLNYKQMQEIRKSLLSVKPLGESVNNLSSFIINPEDNIELAKELTPIVDKLKNNLKIKVVRDMCGPIAWETYYALKDLGYNVKVVNGTFTIDNLDIINKKDFSKEEQREIIKLYGDFSNKHLQEYIKNKELDEMEFKEINHYWNKIDNLIIDLSVSMFYKAMNSKITSNNYKMKRESG